MICKTQKIYRYKDLTSRHCQCIVLGYLTSEFIWIRGILVVFHSLLLFIICSSGSLCIRTASRICLFVGSFLHRSITFISKRCTSFWWTFTQCFHSALSSFFFSRSLRCLFPRVYVFCRFGLRTRTDILLGKWFCMLPQSLYSSQDFLRDIQNNLRQDILSIWTDHSVGAFVRVLFHFSL